MEKASICLSVIVKNESKVILRMLESVKPLVDCYVVVDTGSTDNTKELVFQFLKNNNKKGFVYDKEWVNFSDARNFALEKSKETGCTHSLFIDADEILLIEKDFDLDSFKKKLLEYTGVYVQIEYGNLVYERIQIVKNTDGWYWYGPVHEVLMNKQNKGKLTREEKLKIKVINDGYSWGNYTKEDLKRKYENHVYLLKEYIKKEKDNNPRWVFYLAQSYRDTGTLEGTLKAIETYKKRVEIKEGFQEERYISQLQMALLKKAVNDTLREEELVKPFGSFWKPFFPDAEIERDFLMCSELDSERAEHLYHLILHYYSENMLQTSYVFSKFAFGYFHGKYPKKILFIEKDIYDWKLAEIHSIVCYYLNKKREAKKAFREVLNALNKGVIKDLKEIERIENNKIYFQFN